MERTQVARACIIGEAIPRFVDIVHKLPTDTRATHYVVIAFNEHGAKVMAWLKNHLKPKQKQAAMVGTSVRKALERNT